MKERKAVVGLASSFIDDPEGSIERFAHYCETTPDSERKQRTIFEVRSARLWGASGLQSVTMPHRYAAALMATDVLPTPCRLPWPAFEVRVPNGLLILPDGKEIDSVLCWETEMALGFLVLWPSTSFGFSFPAEDVQSLYQHANDVSYDGTSYSDAGDRAQRMAIRLCMNVILDISTTPSLPAHREPQLSTKRDAKKQVVVTTHVVGRPLDLDCRQDIRDYVSGKRSSEPKVTTLVRGHFRSQVHGPGNTLRKLIWIMPFYRGHGPMLVRSTRLGFRHDEEIT